MMAAGALGISSCQPAQTPEVTAEDVVKKASDVLKAVTAVHFKLSSTGGMMSIGSGLVAKTIEGDVVKPDRLKGTAVSTFGKVTVEISFVIIGTRQFITNPITKSWQALPEAGAAPNLLDPDRGAAVLLTRAQNLKKLANETIAGVECYHLTAGIPASLVAGLVGANGGANALTSDLWIATTDSLPRQIHLVGTVTTEEPPAIERVLELSSFNETITIDAPI
jgi:hypothetical protein